MSFEKQPNLGRETISRVRTGCFTCRRRKKKCDELKPICSGCSRTGLKCHWPSHILSKEDGYSVKPPYQNASPGIGACNPQDYTFCRPEYHVENRSVSISETDLPQDTITVWLSTPLAEDFPELALGEKAPYNQPRIFNSYDTSPKIWNDSNETFKHTVQASLNQGQLPLLATIPLLPQVSHESYELLGHYLSRTVISMGNGSTDSNPFVVQLIPLAFLDPMVLQLLLTQSAAHRAVSGEAFAARVAQAYYNQSLCLFRKNVGEYIDGKKDNALFITVGSLIMCLTEVVKGDVEGVIFNHLGAAKSLLMDLLSPPTLSIPRSLQDFLTEYYVHTATLSMISVDVQKNKLPQISLELVSAANSLVAQNYVGHLCGCWLPLLLLIPQIVELYRKVSTHNSKLRTRSCEDILTFINLQGQIQSFGPNSTVTTEVALASGIYQQAITLYLLTALGLSEPTEEEAYGTFVKDAISQALFYLEQIPPEARINQSLIWPLAVVGSSLSNSESQSIIRNRLQAMLETISLGSIRETLSLLELVWQDSAREKSPWTIWKSMQQHQIWISFA